LKQFSRKNEYYKYYNSEGISTRIKVSEFNQDSFGCLIKFFQNGHWFYHHPKVKFKDQFDCINFILKNLENTNLVFEIIGLKENLSNKSNKEK
jgi:hypothetical protein